MSVRPRSTSDRVLTAAGICLAALVMVVTIRGMVEKGVWYDEIWSKWVTSRELGLADAARQRWFQDVHPPLFYLVNWALSALIGPAVVTHRLLNLVWLGTLGGVGVWLASVRPASRPMLIIGAFLLLSNRDIVMFGEYRSYALVMCAAASLMLLLGEMLARCRDFRWREDRTLIVLLGGSIALALNLHYIATLICGVTVGIFALDRLRAGYIRWFVLLMGVAVAAMVPLLAALLAERAYMKTAVPNFWVTTSVFAAFKMMAGKIIFATGLNVALIGALALEGWHRFRGDPREGSLAGRDPDTAWHFAMLAALSVATAGAMLLAVNTVRPIIEPRYLIALSPIAIAAMASVAAERIVSRRWWIAVFLLNAGGVALFFTASIPRKAAWDEGARMIAAVVRACPDTAVYSMWRMNGLPLDRLTATPNDLSFMMWAMPDVARSYGFSLRFVNPAHPPLLLPRSPGGCPTVLWIEHSAALDGPRTAVVAGLATAAMPRATIRTTHTGTGTVIIVSAS